MEVTTLYKWVDEDTTNGLILQLKDSEIDMLKIGNEAIKDLRRYKFYTNDQIEVVCDLIDKIVAEAK